MEVIYNKIFFNNDKNILFQLQDFTSYYYNGTISEDSIEKAPIKKRDEYITPKQKDSLFWCFFICAFGYGEYTSVIRNYGVKEIEVKQEASVFIKKNYQEFKQISNVKITKSLLEDIMSDFNTHVNDTNFYNFYALCFMYKINIYILHDEKPCYLSFVTNKENPYYLIRLQRYNKYSLKMDKLTLQETVKIETDNYCLDSWLRPIKAVSSYKVTDLQEIAYKINLEDIPNMKKQDLYDYIVESLSWY
tara:strand:+ start:1906 stop:2646 length:741 start_codon:yes stop_codon:yes gene_type:complete